jgi:6-phosphofructokinase 1
MGIKRIGVLTSGGDAPGMNAAIRSVVRTANFHGIEVMGIFKGVEGLINGKMKILNHRSVSNIINKGGTILKTARSIKFTTVEGRKRAYGVVKKRKIGGLVLIGGNGTYRGGLAFHKEWGIPCIGVPGSIDNDINHTDFTIGADTAVNTALEAIDKIKDTATSMERIFVIEVMGRNSGYIAVNVALGSGAENVLIPEKRTEIKQICRDILKGNRKGKVSWIVVVAEGKAKAYEVAAGIGLTTGLETRVVSIGHIQRGGSPTAADRILATRLGEKAVDLLKSGQGGKAIGIIRNKISVVDLSKAIEEKREDVNALCRLIDILA